MKNRRIISVIFLILGLIVSGVILFANTLGLDDHSGWGRIRALSFGVIVLAAAATTFYLAYQSQAELLTADLILMLGKNPSVANFLKAWKEYSFLLPIAALVILIYIWLVSSGTWTHWVSPTRYYANLAKGFENGHLFIPGAPDPRLSELPNPYDPSARQGIEAPIDLSYYNGRYYLYWGPVPALILIPIQKIFHGRVGDLVLTFSFTCGIFVFLSCILIIIWNTHFYNLPKWMLGISIFLAGVSNPILFMLNNFKGARIYEAAITGGQFFLLGGILVVLTTFGKPALNWKLALAGILWALSIATRFFLVLPIATAALVLCYLWSIEKKHLAEKTKKILSLTLPLIFGVIAIGWYNWSRFGSATESGLYYQLAGLNLQKNYSNLIQPAYFFQNFYNYVFNPFGMSIEFPFVQVNNGSTNPIPPYYPLPVLYTSQQITGLLFTVPFVIFALIPFITLFNRKHREYYSQSRSLYLIILIFTASFFTAFM